MAVFESIEHQPVLMYQERDRRGGFIKEIINTGTTNAEKYGKDYDNLAKDRQL